MISGMHIMRRHGYSRERLGILSHVPWVFFLNLKGSGQRKYMKLLKNSTQPPYLSRVAP
jgi:hypothetical protein